MRFRLVLPIVPICSLLLGSYPALAAGGGSTSSGSPTGGSPTADPRPHDDISGSPIVAQRGASVNVQLEGRVVDAAGNPLPGIVVKTFANGVLAGSSKTQGDGTFTLAAHPMREAKGSAVVWFQTPDAQRYLDTFVVLWAGKTAQDRHLFPECTPILKSIGNAANLEVTMRSVAERREAVIASKCFEEEDATSSP